MNEESSFVDLSSMGIDDVPEVYIMPSGSEVEARVVSAMKKRDKNETLFIMPFFDVPAEPDVAEFSKYIPLPTEGESEKENNNRKRTLKLFGECFGSTGAKDLRSKKSPEELDGFFWGLARAKNTVSRTRSKSSSSRVNSFVHKLTIGRTVLKRAVCLKRS